MSFRLAKVGNAVNASASTGLPQTLSTVARRAEQTVRAANFLEPPLGFTRQSADSLAPTNWLNAPSGPTNPVTVPATLLAKFYRLFKP
jgi:hypothetical protein